ncbi:MAG: hypothetical protein DWQ29_05120 [Planctomycetota bacterium]|nr:MAG: hypothetical protein DWQ29_05120 [Planctomycetota bacterium]
MSLRERYRAVAECLVEAHPIPELPAGFVPQGIARLPDSSTVALSLYHDRGRRASILVLVDGESGTHLGSLPLHVNGSPLVGHVGGIAVCRGYLWVASEGRLYRFKSPSAEAAIDGVLSSEMSFAVDSEADCLSSQGDLLWVGEFAHGSRYRTASHHRQNGCAAWAAAYRVDEAGMIDSTATYEVGGRSVLRPELVVFVPDQVQGIAFREDFIAISTSYGPADSRLTVYDSPLTQQPLAVELHSGGTVPGYVLDEQKTVVRMALPAGAEDLEWSGRQLLVGFEGAARRYRSRWSLSGAFIEDRYYVLDPVADALPADGQVRVRIDATDPGWRPAGVRLLPGQSLEVRCQGRITLQKHRLDDYPYVTADGQSGELRSSSGVRGPNGCLLVKIGVKVYAAGANLVIDPETAGEVQLAILENGDPANNDGSFSVELTVRNRN